MLIYFAFAAAGVGAGVSAFLLYMMNPQFRAALDGIWGHYVINTMMNGWKFLAVVLLYLALVNGSIAALVRAITQ